MPPHSERLVIPNQKAREQFPSLLEFAQAAKLRNGVNTLIKKPPLPLIEHNNWGNESPSQVCCASGEAFFGTIKW